VDERSILDVTPNDLIGYGQCHFFAGIGGWSHALRLAGVPDDEPVWTGSCPCQPFSAAGRGDGIADERHLWPHWFHLISQCRPSTVFGEQVASKAGLHWWFDLVQADLEGSGYITAAADLCAAGVGAPHVRQRLYFAGKRLADMFGTGRRQVGRDTTGNLATHGIETGNRVGNGGTDGFASRMADAEGTRPSHRGHGSIFTPAVTARDRSITNEPTTITTDDFWGNPDWLFCQDDKRRPVEPRTFPLVNGVSERVGLLRGYGNAIVPQVAQAFIEAVMAC
jgi:DNA (cytosine-5)-methyltransferase 1